MNGKGSRRRPPAVDREAADAAWQRTFGAPWQSARHPMGWVDPESEPEPETEPDG